MRRERVRVAWLAVVAVLVLPGVCLAQAVSAEDRASLVRLAEARGGEARDVDALLRLAGEAAGRGLPARPIVDKIREGLAKGYPPARIDRAVQEVAGRLGTASGLFGEMNVAATGAAVERLADAIGAGVTPDEVRDLRRRAGDAQAPLDADALAGAAMGLSSIKEAGLPAGEGAAVMAEALRQGYRPYEVRDVGLEVKRRERDYQTGNATLAALREAIERGDRPDRLFLDRPVTPERPTRVERPTRPEPAPRPERPTRPERPAGGSPTR
jgi:hypothetical protein